MKSCTQATAKPSIQPVAEVITQKQGSVVSVRQFNLFMSVSTRSHQALGASIHTDDAPVPMHVPVLRSVRSAVPDLRLTLAKRLFLRHP